MLLRRNPLIPSIFPVIFIIYYLRQHVRPYSKIEISDAALFQDRLCVLYRLPP